MTIKRRLAKIEKAAGGNGVIKADCIYLCALTSHGEPSEPQVALLMGNTVNDSISRLFDESAPDFVARVEGILVGDHRSAADFVKPEERVKTIT